MSWEEAIPETLTYDNNGTQSPLREHPFIRESPDLGHFAQKALETQRELGSRVPLKIEKVRDDQGRFVPKAESVADWRKNHLPKLYEAGVIEQPPAKPEDYQITPPENLGDGIGWSDELSKKLATTLHKHGIPKAAVGDLLALHSEALLGTQRALATDFEKGTAALRQEFGANYDSLREQAKRLTKAIFKSPDEVAFFNDTGIGDHPLFISVLMRLAPLAAQDNGIVKDIGGVPAVSGEDVRAELADIMQNKNNPRHQGYMSGDESVHEYVRGLYKKAHGTAQIVI